MRFYLLFFPLCLVLTSCSNVLQTSVPSLGVEARVVRVLDGDTLEVSDAVGTLRKLRVLGIDAPEIQHSPKVAECFGPEAKEFARSTLLLASVHLVSDPSQAVKDRFGRLLAYVVLPDGRDYSVEAVRAGMARTYVYSDHPVLKHSALVEAERDAQNARLGLWGSCMFW